tara:strand:+ start:163 stop:1146 length:984 start_codon:yes stop_codon:yes gene_type:complete
MELNMKAKRQTLNNEKRKTIADVFQTYWEREESPITKKYELAKAKYNDVRKDMKVLVEDIVRKFQPSDDVETIRAMSNKYGDSGGQLYNDSCFNFQTEITKVDDEGKEYQTTNDINIDFGLEPYVQSNRHNFAYAYYRDELKQNGCNPDFVYKWADEKRNPRYYEEESNCRKFLGFQSNNDVSSNQTIKPNQEWENDFKLWVIGTSYCRSRMFKVDSKTYKMLEQYTLAQQNLVQAHENIFNYVENKMAKLRLGLKSYKYFDQAKALADKLGIPLNESVLNESSSMALSIYSPENLASLLEDKVEPTKAEKIAIAKKLLAQQVASLN